MTTKNSELDATTLALVAAQPRFANLSQTKAIRGAVDFWKECCGTILLERSIRGYSPELQAFHWNPPDVPRPKQWPASRVDFYRLIVRGKDNPCSEARFKDFLKETLRLSHIPAAFDSFGESFWIALGADYLRWWNFKKQEGKSRAGRMGAAKRLTLKQSLTKMLAAQKRELAKLEGKKHTS